MPSRLEILPLSRRRVAGASLTYGLPVLPPSTSTVSSAAAAAVDRPKGGKANSSATTTTTTALTAATQVLAGLRQLRTATNIVTQLECDISDCDCGQPRRVRSLTSPTAALPPTPVQIKYASPKILCLKSPKAVCLKSQAQSSLSLAPSKLLKPRRRRSIRLPRLLSPASLHSTLPLSSSPKPTPLRSSLTANEGLTVLSSGIRGGGYAESRYVVPHCFVDQIKRSRTSFQSQATTSNAWSPRPLRALESCEVHPPQHSKRNVQVSQVDFLELEHFTELPGNTTTTFESIEYNGVPLHCCLSYATPVSQDAVELLKLLRELSAQAAISTPIDAAKLVEKATSLIAQDEGVTRRALQPQICHRRHERQTKRPLFRECPSYECNLESKPSVSEVLRLCSSSVEAAPLTPDAPEGMTGEPGTIRLPNSAPLGLISRWKHHCELQRSTQPSPSHSASAKEVLTAANSIPDSCPARYKVLHNKESKDKLPFEVTSAYGSPVSATQGATSPLYPDFTNTSSLSTTSITAVKIKCEDVKANVQSDLGHVDSFASEQSALQPLCRHAGWATHTKRLISRRHNQLAEDHTGSSHDAPDASEDKGEMAPLIRKNWSAQGRCTFPELKSRPNAKLMSSGERKASLQIDLEANSRSLQASTVNLTASPALLTEGTIAEGTIDATSDRRNSLAAGVQRINQGDRSTSKDNAVRAVDRHCDGELRSTCECSGKSDAEIVLSSQATSEEKVSDKEVGSAADILWPPVIQGIQRYLQRPRNRCRLEELIGCLPSVCAEFLGAFQPSSLTAPPSTTDQLVNQNPPTLVSGILAGGVGVVEDEACNELPSAGWQAVSLQRLPALDGSAGPDDGQGVTARNEIESSYKRLTNPPDCLITADSATSEGQHVPSSWKSWFLDHALQNSTVKSTLAKSNVLGAPIVSDLQSQLKCYTDYIREQFEAFYLDWLCPGFNFSQVFSSHILLEAIMSFFQKRFWPAKRLFNLLRKFDFSKLVALRNPAARQRPRRYRLSDAAACIKAHPSKQGGGEDAYFISSDDGTRSLGVADGVSEWSRFGVNPRYFAEELMRHCQIIACNTPLTSDGEVPGDNRPRRILEKAFEATESVGGSTACIAGLTSDGTALEFANLGDSSLAVLKRDPVTGRYIIAFKTLEQQHDTNQPYQLMRMPALSAVPLLREKGLNVLADVTEKYYREGGNSFADSPKDAETGRVPLGEGHLVILGSDGFWDNLHEEEIVDLVSLAVAPHEVSAEGLERSTRPDALAQCLAEAAACRSREIPSGGRFHGRRWKGGVGCELGQNWGEEVKNEALFSTFQPQILNENTQKLSFREASSEGPKGGKLDDIVVVVAWVVGDAE